MCISWEPIDKDGIAHKSRLHYEIFRKAVICRGMGSMLMYVCVWVCVGATQFTPSIGIPIPLWLAVCGSSVSLTRHQKGNLLIRNLARLQPKSKIKSNSSKGKCRVEKLWIFAPFACLNRQLIFKSFKATWRRLVTATNPTTSPLTYFLSRPHTSLFAVLSQVDRKRKHFSS